MASNDDGSTDEENKVFFKKEECYETFPTCPTCPVCLSAFSKCSCKATNDSFHEEISNGTTRNLTEDKFESLTNGQNSPSLKEKATVDGLDRVYNTGNTFLLDLQKTSATYDSKSYVGLTKNHDLKDTESNPKSTVDAGTSTDSIKSVNTNGDNLFVCLNTGEDTFCEVVRKSDAPVKNFCEDCTSDNCDNVKSENVLNDMDNKENYDNARCDLEETDVFSKTRYYSNNLFSTNSPKNVNSEKSPSNYISTSASPSKTGCDLTCNIGAVKSPIDSPSDSENRELSPERVLQNSNVNNNNNITTTIHKLSNMDHFNSRKPKKKICSHLVEQLDYDLLKGKKGIDLLTAIEEQSNVNLKNLERHASSSAESGNNSSKEVICSPRKGRTRSVDVAAKPSKGVKRAHSADVTHSDIKLRKIDFKQYRKEKKTSVPSSSKISKHREERKHSFSRSKHDSKSKERSSKKSDTSHSSSSKESSRHFSSSRRGDCKPRLLTNGNYSYPPENSQLSRQTRRPGGGRGRGQRSGPRGNRANQRGGAAREGDRNERRFRGEEQVEDRNTENRKAPKVDDERDFPSLG